MAFHSAAVFAFLLATFAVTSFGSPIKRTTVRHACGSAVVTDPKTNETLGSRHGIVKILKAVEKQIAFARKYIENQEKNFNKLYGQVQELKEESYNKSYWLPHVPQNEYLKGNCSQGMATKVKKNLKDFHRALKNYSAIFAELKKFVPESNAQLRNKTIKGVAEQLDQVICEVQWALLCLNVTKPEAVGAGFVQKVKTLNKYPDTTELLVQDWGIILSLKKFLDEWHLTVRSSKKTECVTKNKKKNKKKNNRKPTRNSNSN